jgi:hypothetical protein
MNASASEYVMEPPRRKKPPAAAWTVEGLKSDPGNCKEDHPANRRSESCFCPMKQFCREYGNDADGWNIP